MSLATTWYTMAAVGLITFPAQTALLMLSDPSLSKRTSTSPRAALTVQLKLDFTNFVDTNWPGPIAQPSIGDLSSPAPLPLI